MTTTNYGTKIVKNLEAKGYTKDMIIGYLEGALNGLKYLDSKQVDKHLQQDINHSEK